jgi:hypothetical protein
MIEQVWRHFLLFFVTECFDGNEIKIRKGRKNRENNDDTMDK